MSDPIVETALATLAGQIADLRGLLEAVLDGQRILTQRVTALEESQRAADRAHSSADTMYYHAPTIDRVAVKKETTAAAVATSTARGRDISSTSSLRGPHSGDFVRDPCAGINPKLHRSAEEAPENTAAAVATSTTRGRDKRRKETRAPSPGAGSSTRPPLSCFVAYHGSSKWYSQWLLTLSCDPWRPPPDKLVDRINWSDHRSFII